MEKFPGLQQFLDFPRFSRFSQHLPSNWKDGQKCTKFQYSLWIYKKCIYVNWYSNTGYLSRCKHGGSHTRWPGHSFVKCSLRPPDGVPSQASASPRLVPTAEEAPADLADSQPLRKQRYPNICCKKKTYAVKTIEVLKSSWENVLRIQPFQV